MQQTTYSKQIYGNQTRASSLHRTLHQTYLQQQIIASNLKQPNLIIFQQPNNDDQTTGNTLVIELKVLIEAYYSLLTLCSSLLLS